MRLFHTERWKLNKGCVRQYCAAISCHLSAMMCGVGFVWFTPIMVDTLGGKIANLTLEYDSLAWLVAIIEIGELITPIPAGLLVNKWGRKLWMLSTFVMMMFSWTLMALTRRVWVLFVARLIMGGAVGVMLTVDPIYIAEIAQPGKRGELCAHLQTFWWAGVTYAYTIGPLMEYQTYVYASIVPACLFLVTFAFAPESPYYLVMSNREEEAMDSLRWLRGRDGVHEEMEQIKQAVLQETSSGKTDWKKLFYDKKTATGLLVVSAGSFSKYFGGSTAVINYATKSFSDSPGNAIPAPWATFAMGILLVFTTTLSSLLSDKLGRKPLILFSCLGQGLFALFIALYYYLERETHFDISPFEYLLYLSLAGYSIVSNLSIVLFALQAEYFSSDVRGAAGAFITCFSTSIVFVSLKQYQIVEVTIGLYANYIIFALSCFLGLFILVLFMKETANKSLAEIQIM